MDCLFIGCQVHQEPGAASGLGKGKGKVVSVALSETAESLVGPPHSVAEEGEGLSGPTSEPNSGSRGEGGWGGGGGGALEGLSAVSGSYIPGSLPDFSVVLPLPRTSLKTSGRALTPCWMGCCRGGPG